MTRVLVPGAYDPFTHLFLPTEASEASEASEEVDWNCTLAEFVKKNESHVLAEVWPYVKETDLGGLSLRELLNRLPPIAPDYLIGWGTLKALQAGTGDNSFGIACILFVLIDALTIKTGWESLVKCKENLAEKIASYHRALNDPQTPALELESIKSQLGAAMRQAPSKLKLILQSGGDVFIPLISNPIYWGNTYLKTELLEKAGELFDGLTEEEIRKISSSSKELTEFLGNSDVKINDSEGLNYFKELVGTTEKVVEATNIIGVIFSLWSAGRGVMEIINSNEVRTIIQSIIDKNKKILEKLGGAPGSILFAYLLESYKFHLYAAITNIVKGAVRIFNSIMSIAGAFGGITGAASTAISATTLLLFRALAGLHAIFTKFGNYGLDILENISNFLKNEFYDGLADGKKPELAPGIELPHQVLFRDMQKLRDPENLLNILKSMGKEHLIDALKIKKLHEIVKILIQLASQPDEALEQAKNKKFANAAEELDSAAAEKQKVVKSIDTPTNEERRSVVVGDKTPKVTFTASKLGEQEMRMSRTQLFFTAVRIERKLQSSIFAKRILTASRSEINAGEVDKLVRHGRLLHKNGKFEKKQSFIAKAWNFLLNFNRFLYSEEANDLAKAMNNEGGAIGSLKASTLVGAMADRVTSDTTDIDSIVACRFKTTRSEDNKEIETAEAIELRSQLLDVRKRELTAQLQQLVDALENSDGKSLRAIRQEMLGRASSEKDTELLYLTALTLFKSDSALGASENVDRNITFLKLVFAPDKPYSATDISAALGLINGSRHDGRIIDPDLRNGVRAYFGSKCYSSEAEDPFVFLRLPSPLNFTSYAQGLIEGRYTIQDLPPEVMDKGVKRSLSKRKMTSADFKALVAQLKIGMGWQKPEKQQPLALLWVKELSRDPTDKAYALFLHGFELRRFSTISSKMELIKMHGFLSKETMSLKAVEKWVRSRKPQSGQLPNATEAYLLHWVLKSNTAIDTDTMKALLKDLRATKSSAAFKNVLLEMKQKMAKTSEFEEIFPFESGEEKALRVTAQGPKPRSDLQSGKRAANTQDTVNNSDAKFRQLAEIIFEASRSGARTQNSNADHWERVMKLLIDLNSAKAVDVFKQLIESDENSHAATSARHILRGMLGSHPELKDKIWLILDPESPSLNGAGTVADGNCIFHSRGREIDGKYACTNYQEQRQGLVVELRRHDGRNLTDVGIRRSVEDYRQSLVYSYLRSKEIPAGLEEKDLQKQPFDDLDPKAKEVIYELFTEYCAKDGNFLSKDLLPVLARLSNQAISLYEPHRGWTHFNNLGEEVPEAAQGAVFIRFFNEHFEQVTPQNIPGTNPPSSMVIPQENGDEFLTGPINVEWLQHEREKLRGLVKRDHFTVRELLNKPPKEVVEDTLSETFQKVSQRILELGLNGAGTWYSDADRWEGWMRYLIDLNSERAVGVFAQLIESNKNSRPATSAKKNLRSMLESHPKLQGRILSILMRAKRPHLMGVNPGTNPLSSTVIPQENGGNSLIATLQKVGLKEKEKEELQKLFKENRHQSLQVFT